MKKYVTHIHIGINEPFRLWHISDTHLCLADERNDERKMTLAKHRAAIFPFAESDLKEIIELRKENEGLIVHTGDLIDFTSEANYDAARAFAKESGCFFAAGNHEFSQYVGEAWEDEAYRNQSLNATQSCFQNNIRFSSKIYHGVNLVAIDNSYYLFEPWQFESFKKEVEKGYPIILLMHCPLFEKHMFQTMVDFCGIGYAMGASKDDMATYPPERIKQQLPDNTTIEMIEYIKNEPLVKGILCGHIHKSLEGMVTKNLPQYSVCMGEVREVLVD